MAKIGVAKKDAMNFNGGEISPLLEGRVDLDIYGRACRQLQNSIPRKYGNAERRVGTRFVAEAKYADKKCINISFDLSSTVSLNIEMGEYYFRFFRNGSAIMNGSSIYEVSHPYPESALSSVAFVQINDVVYMTHPDYPPYKLSHYADNNWTMIAVPFDEPVFMDMNTTSTTITPSGVSGSVTLTASSGIFNEGHIGAYFKLGQIRAANRVEISLLASVTSLPIELKGAFTVRTSGTWAGTLEVQRLNTLTSAWETIYTHISDQDRNVEASYKQEDVSAQWRLVYTFISKDSTSPKAYLESAESYVYGWAKVTAFASSTSVTALVADSFLNTTATNTWYEGAWSSYRGFPAACALFQQRMVYSGTYFQPQTIWGSVTNDYQNFEYGTDDDKAFQYTIGSQERLSTQWLCVHSNALIIGTSTGDWAMSGSNGGDDPVTPTNVIIRRQSTTGDARIQPVVVGNAILHVQRNGKKLYEMTYSIQSYGYDDQDISQFAEHITGDGIVGIAYQRQPDGIIYCVRPDGVLLMCVYDQAQKVIAWSRMVTQGFVESAAVIYGPVGDEVWLVVRRNVNGTWKRLIERLYPVLWDSKIDCWYLDCGYLAWNGGGGGNGGGNGGGGNGGGNGGGGNPEYVRTIAIESVPAQLSDVCYSATLNLYVSTSGGGSYGPYRSNDGKNWIDPSSHSALQLFGVCRSDTLGVFVAVGFSLSVITSLDGISWVNRYINTNTIVAFKSVAFKEGYGFVIIGDQILSGPDEAYNAILTSPDGVTWTEHFHSFAGGSISRMIYASGIGKFVAVGTFNRPGGGYAHSAYSVDGITWTVSDAQASTGVGGTWISWSPELGMLCEVTNSPTLLRTSQDGIMWSDVTIPAPISPYSGGTTYDSVAWSSNIGKFCVIPNGGSNVLYSSDGITWEQVPIYLNSWTAICSGLGGEFVVVGYDPISSIVSIDGIFCYNGWEFRLSSSCNWSSGDRIIISGTNLQELDNNELVINSIIDGNIIFSDSIINPYHKLPDIGTVRKVRKKVHEITGLDELAGATVDANCDGDPVMDLTVSPDGTITLPGYYDQVIIGLRYETIFEPMATQMSSETGSALAQVQRIRSVDVRLKDTLGAKVTTDVLQYHEICDAGTISDGGEINYKTVVFRDTSDVVSSTPELFTGIMSIPLEQHHSMEPRVILKQEAPMPFNVLGMTFKYEITEPSSGKAQQ